MGFKGKPCKTESTIQFHLKSDVQNKCDYKTLLTIFVFYSIFNFENSQLEPQSIYSPLQHADITVLWKFRQLFWLRNRQRTQRLRNPTSTSSMWDALLLRQQDQKRTGQIPNKVGEQMCVSSKLPGFHIYIYVCRESYLSSSSYTRNLLCFATCHREQTRYGS